MPLPARGSAPEADLLAEGRFVTGRSLTRAASSPTGEGERQRSVGRQVDHRHGGRAPCDSDRGLEVAQAEMRERGERVVVVGVVGVQAHRLLGLLQRQLRLAEKDVRERDAGSAASASFGQSASARSKYQAA